MAADFSLGMLRAGRHRQVPLVAADALALPFQIGGRELRVTASVGVALWTGSTGVEDLLRHADAAIHPAHGELAATGWSHPTVTRTRSVGVAAGAEILRWLCTAAASPG